MRQEKQLLLDDIQDQIETCGTFVILQYSGLSANAATDFRNEVAKLGGSIEMVPKRVLVKAAEAAGVPLERSALPGHISLVFAGDDPVPVTKSVYEFKKANAKVIEVLGGRFDNQFFDAEQVEMLSKLPGINEMRAQLLSVFEAPLSQTLAVMEALMTSVVYCLDNKCKQQGADQ